MVGIIKGIVSALMGGMPVRHGRQTVNAKPHFEEAFRALPFINPKHKDHFAAAFVKHWDDGTLERRLLKEKLPEDYFQNLNGKKPADAIKAVSMRAFCRIVAEARAMDEADARKAGGFLFNEAVCDVNVACCCEKAKAMNGKVVPLNKRTRFPLPGCDADWCNCMWIAMRGKRKR